MRRRLEAHVTMQAEADAPLQARLPLLMVAGLSVLAQFPLNDWVLAKGHRAQCGAISGIPPYSSWMAGDLRKREGGGKTSRKGKGVASLW